jgi:hypothetical protein
MTSPLGYQVHEPFMRRPRWDGFAWITLADGQEWALPMVEPSLLGRVPGLIDALADLVACPRIECPTFAGFPTNDIEREASRSAWDAFYERCRRVRAVAWLLISVNYFLSDDVLEALVGGPDFEELVLESRSMPWWESISGAIGGMGHEAVALVKCRGIASSLN